MSDVDRLAFLLLDYSDEQRHALFVNAFEHAMAKHPTVTEIEPRIVAFVAAVYRRIAEMEREQGTA